MPTWGELLKRLQELQAQGRRDALDVIRREERAKGVASALSDHEKLRTHGRPLDRNYLRSLGMRIDLLESDQNLQDKVLTAYHACMHTFSATAATKIIENHQGRAFIKLAQQVVIQGPPPTQPVPPQQPPPARPQPGAPSS